MIDQSYQAWARQVQQLTEPFITEEELGELFAWTAKHGSGNGWTGSTGRVSMLIRYLMADRERLRRLLSEQQGNAESFTALGVTAGGG